MGCFVFVFVSVVVGFFESDLETFSYKHEMQMSLDGILTLGMH